MELDATVGTATANSYVTVEAATALLEGHLHPEAWDTASDTARIAALVTATRLLDQAVLWYGTPTSSVQALAWPQTGQRDLRGRPLAPTTIPAVIEQATAFYALALVQDTNPPGGGEGLGEVASVRTGDTQIVYRDRTHLPPSPQVQVPADIRRMLAPYGFVTGGHLIPLERS